MTRATICAALLFTMWASVGNALLGGSPWPMVAASALCLFAACALPQHAPFYPCRN